MALMLQGCPVELQHTSPLLAELQYNCREFVTKEAPSRPSRRVTRRAKQPLASRAGAAKVAAEQDAQGQGCSELPGLTGCAPQR